ncbi:hypothetical protein [Shimazuella alba]|uniref:Uncharacterized protein n=1 Tax=Shimazuella alba TaxID=2690964 RepID=A0A6I4VPM3_9BACL|nr:hypothetical protein [Shimazuella alba]MXQ53587.1 hypothetical protein [Shimazuella alba]
MNLNRKGEKFSSSSSMLQSVEPLLEVTSLNRFDSFEPLLLEFATLEQSFSCCYQISGISTGASPDRKVTIVSLNFCPISIPLLDVYLDEIKEMCVFLSVVSTSPEP